MTRVAAKPATIELTRENVLEYVREKDYVSFVELERDFIGFTGTKVLTPKGYEQSIVFWVNVSQKALDVMIDLAVNELALKPCHVMFYFTDGKCLDLPIAKKLYHYKEPRWLPVMLIVDPDYKLGAKAGGVDR